MPVDTLQFSLLDWLQGELPGVRLFVHLFVGEVDFESPLALGELVEPSFAGYEPREFVPSTPPNDFEEGHADVVGNMVWWEDEGGDAHEDHCRGYFVVARYPDDSVQYVSSEPFGVAKVMNAKGNRFAIAVQLFAAVSVLE